MKKRKLLNYFKNFALMQIIGGVVLAVGFLIWWYAFEIWFLGTPIMLVGIALLATGGILKVGDKDYEEHFKLLMRDFIRRELEQKPYKSFCGFECEGASYAKLRRDGVLCTERYYIADIFLSNTELTVDVCEAKIPEDSVTTATHRFDLAKLDVSTRQSQFTKNGISRTVTYLKLDDGKECCEICVPSNDISVDELVEKLKNN